MSKAIKRGNNWRVTVYDYTDENGKQHNKTFTADTKVRAEFLAADFKANKKKRSKKGHDLTVGEAIDRYIELKALLSPTTLTAYRRVRKYAFPDLMNIKVSRLDDETLQREINKEVLRISPNGTPLSPKTVKNEYALVSGALREVCHLTFFVTLPKTQKHIKDLPEVSEVMSAIIGTEIELPCILALWLSFSMSEIRGLQYTDIKDGYITINRVKVDTDQGEIVKDTAKVETRLRRHKLPTYLEELIWRTKGDSEFLVPQNRKTIYEKWVKLCEEHNLGHLSFHSLRHINCSLLVSLGISEKVLLERGGWKSSFVPKSVYTHSFTSDRVEADKVVDAYFYNLLQDLHQKI